MSISTLELFCAKKCWKKKRKKQCYSRNETILKIAYLPKAIPHALPLALAKWSIWVKNQNGQKHAQNGCTRGLELFCAKNRWKKHQIFQKWDDFENRPSWKASSICKGHRLWKMVSLSQKLKWPKTFLKRLYKKTRVVLCKKPLEKTPNIREMRRFWKLAILERL